MKEKAVLFISEYLVIFLEKEKIVNNMHEAYARIEMDPKYNFGTFISGPSKTADIEQALVMVRKLSWCDSYTLVKGRNPETFIV